MSDPTDPGWPNTTPKVIAEAMHILDVASRDGVKNQPPENQGHLSQFEQEIVGHFMRLLDEARAFAESMWKRARQPIEDINPSALDAELAGIEQKIKVESAELRNTHGVTLQSRHNDWSAANAELLSFKIRERREGAPHYPENKWPIYAAFSVVFLIEAIMNANFYAQGSTLGLIGGLIAALVVAFVFLILAKMFSISLQQIWLISPFRKAIGLFLCIILFLMTFAAALLAGHYRTAAGIDPKNAESIAWESFISTPFELGAFSSFILTILSLLICASYVYMFFKSDDPYPGYGSRARKEVDLRQDYEDELKGLTKEIRNRRELMETCVRTVQAKIQSARNVVLTPPDSDPIIRRYENWLQTAENDCQAVLTQYRQINCELRTERAPTYFNMPFSFDENQRKIQLSGKDRLARLCEEAEKELRTLATRTADLVTKTYQMLNPDVIVGKPIDV